MTYDLDNYSPPPTAPEGADPENGHQAQRAEPKSTYSGIRILEIGLAAVVVLAVVVGLAREFTPESDPTTAIPPDQLERAFNFAPSAPDILCEFSDVIAINNSNGNERLKFRAIINEDDETVTIQAEREGDGWIGISINDSSGMVPNVAVIGTPADGKADMYFLGGKNRGAIEIAPIQTVTSAETLQEDGRTILSFTVGLNDFDGASVIPGESARIMWAIGGEGDSSFERAHAFDSRGFATINIASCNAAGGAGGEVDAVPFDFAPSAPVAGCQFEGTVETINNGAGDEKLKFRAIVNEQDETVTIQAEREGDGWIGISINDSQGMVPNEAVIGTPADGKAEMYLLGGKSRSAIEKSPLQTISSAETLQRDGRTILSFTLGFDDFDGASIIPGEATRIMWAIGGEGDSLFERAHTFDSRGFTTINIASCNAAGGNGGGVDAVPFDFAPDAPVADCGFEDTVETINNGAGEERLKFRAIVNEQDETVTIQAEREGDGWIGISINDSQGMVPNVAAIGTPEDGNVQWYNLAGKNRAAVTLMGNGEQQKLSSAETIQQDGRTVVSFTIPLTGGAPEISSGPTRVMWAIGQDGDSTLAGAHPFDSRGFTTINFPSCGLAPVPPPPTTPPTRSPTTKPTTPSPTSAPVVAQVEEKKSLVFNFGVGAGEEDVQQFQDKAKVYSKTGNRRSCQADVCPGTWWNLSTNNGCSCSPTDNVDTCYQDGSPATVESYYEIDYVETWSGSGKYTMSATGTETELGAGGDHASAEACYEDWRRGGFKVDLAGTVWAFHEDSTIWVGGYSPSMKIWADEQIVEMHRNNQDTTMSWKIPQGTLKVEVVCGGWPANCWSELSAFKPTAVNY